MINSGLLNFMSRTKKLMIAILIQPLYDQWGSIHGSNQGRCLEN